MKNLTKRLSSLVVVMALVLGMIVPVHAGTGQKITIDNTGADKTVSIKGNIYTLHKIYDVTHSVVYNTYGYKLADDFLDLPGYVAGHDGGVFNAFLAGKAASAQTLMDYIASLQLSDSQAMHAFAKVVNEYVIEENITPPAKHVQTALVEKVEFLDLDLGYYLVLGNVKTLDNGEIVFGVAGLRTNDDCVTFVPKADAPTIDKKVWDVADEDLDELVADEDWKDSTDAQIGDDVKFQIISTIPNMNGYTAYTYIVHDVLSKGLTFNNDVEITLLDPSGAEVTGKTVGNYTVTPVLNANAAGDTFITITFDKMLEDWYEQDSTDSTKSTWAGYKFAIEYTAELNKNAVIAHELPDNYNFNEVKLKYSNNPYDTTTNETPEVLVKVYTFKVDVLKFADLESGPVYLADAKFRLYKTESDAEAAVNLLLANGTLPTDGSDGAIAVVAGSSIDSENLYIVDKGGSNYDMVTPSNGKITVKGLDEGFYYFVETEAPEGFNLLEAPVPVGIDATYDPATGDLVSISQWIYNEVSKDFEWGTGITNVADLFAKLLIENLYGSKLPETGGIGRTIFTVAGSGMMLAAAVIMIAKRKTRFQ